MPDLIVDIIEVASTGKRHIFNRDNRADCGQRYRNSIYNKRSNGGAETLSCWKCIEKLKKEMGNYE